jgi:hypothetical protein
MDTVQQLLKELAADETWRGLGARLGFPASYLHDVSSGKRPPSEDLLRAIGLRRVVKYQPIRSVRA